MVGPATVTYAGKADDLGLHFISDPHGAGRGGCLRLRPYIARTGSTANDPIDAVEPALIEAFGAGEPVEREI